MMTFSSLYNVLLSLKLIIAFIRMYLMLYAPSPALRPRQQGPLPLAMSFRVWLSPLPTPPCHRIHRGQGDWVMPTWNLGHSGLLDLVWEPWTPEFTAQMVPSPFQVLPYKGRWCYCVHTLRLRADQEVGVVGMSTDLCQTCGGRGRSQRQEEGVVGWRLHHTLGLVYKC